MTNEIAVLPASLFDDQLRYGIARAIYENPNFWHYAARANPSIHIVVERGHVTLTGVVDSETDRQLARGARGAVQRLLGHQRAPAAARGDGGARCARIGEEFTRRGAASGRRDWRPLMPPCWRRTEMKLLRIVVIAAALAAVNCNGTPTESSRGAWTRKDKAASQANPAHGTRRRTRPGRPVAGSS